VCAIKAWSISSACKNLRAQHPLRAETLCAEKYPLRWVNMHLCNFFVRGPKFTRFLLSNVGGVVVDQLRVRFLTCRPFPGMFAIKFEKLSEIAPKFGRQCHYLIRALKHIRPLLTLEAAKTFAVSLVGSKLLQLCTVRHFSEKPGQTSASAECSGASYCAGAMVSQRHRPPPRSTLAANQSACYL